VARARVDESWTKSSQTRGAGAGWKYEIGPNIRHPTAAVVVMFQFHSLLAVRANKQTEQESSEPWWFLTDIVVSVAGPRVHNPGGVGVIALRFEGTSSVVSSARVRFPKTTAADDPPSVGRVR